MTTGTAGRSPAKRSHEPIRRPLPRGSGRRGPRRGSGNRATDPSLHAAMQRCSDAAFTQLAGRRDRAPGPLVDRRGDQVGDHLQGGGHRPVVGPDNSFVPLDEPGVGEHLEVMADGRPERLGRRRPPGRSAAFLRSRSLQ